MATSAFKTTFMSSFTKSNPNPVKALTMTTEGIDLNEIGLRGVDTSDFLQVALTANSEAHGKSISFSMFPKDNVMLGDRIANISNKDIRVPVKYTDKDGF